MTTYLIVYGLDPTDRLAAYAFPTRSEAQRASRQLVPAVAVDGYGRPDPNRETRPGVGGCGYVVERDEDVQLSGARLVEVYNGLTGENVARFESRSVGVKRLISRLPAVAVEAGQPKEDLMSDAAAAHPSEAQSPNVERAGRRPKYRDDAIFALVDGNPWRDGKNNHARLSAALAATSEPRTVKAVVDAGLTRGDISYLVEHGKATVTDPA